MSSMVAVLVSMIVSFLVDRLSFCEELLSVLAFFAPQATRARVARTNWMDKTVFLMLDWVEQLFQTCGFVYID